MDYSFQRLRWPTISTLPVLIAMKMEVYFTFGGLKLKVSIEPVRKPVFVRGHFRVTGGKKVHVKPHFRRK